MPRVSVLLALVSLLVSVCPAVAQHLPTPALLDHHLASGFRNLSPTYDYTMTDRVRRYLRATLRGFPERGPVPSPITNDGADLRANRSAPTITWIGHATFLVQLDGLNIVTDPVWRTPERTWAMRLMDFRMIQPEGPNRCRW